MAKQLFNEDVFSDNFNSLDEGLIEVDNNTGMPVDSTPKDSKVDIQDNKEVKDDEEKDLIEIPDYPSKDNDKKDIEVNLDNKDTKEDTPNSDNKLSPFAAVLKEKGVLPNIDLKELSKLNSEDQIDYLVDKQDELIANGISQWIDTLPPVLQRVVENYAEGVPLNRILNVVDKLTEYSSIKEEDLVKDDAMMKRVLLEDKISKGYSKADAEEEIDSLVDLEKPAKSALKRLQAEQINKLDVDKQRALKDKNAFEQRNRDTINYVSKIVKDSKEIIPGLPLNEMSKSRIMESMFQPVDYDKNGNPISKVQAMRNEDPIRFELAIHYLADITNGFTDYSKLVKSAKTNAVKELEKELDRDKMGTGSVSNYRPTTKSTNLISSIKKLIQH